jgi:hypothetical protein
VSFADITLCVASQLVFVVVSICFVINSVRKLLVTSSYVWHGTANYLLLAAVPHQCIKVRWLPCVAGELPTFLNDSEAHYAYVNRVPFKMQ